MGIYQFCLKLSGGKNTMFSFLIVLYRKLHAARIKALNEALSFPSTSVFSANVFDALKIQIFQKM